MIKPDLSLPIDSPPPAGLVRLREDRTTGVAEYGFCVGVSRHHARALAAQARAINYTRQSHRAAAGSE